MNKMIAFVCLLFLVAASGCVADNADSKKNAAGKTKILRIGHTLTDDSHYGAGLAKFAELVKHKSKGSLEVQVYGNAKLGNERDVLEGVSLGTVEMCLISSGPLPSFSKKFMVFDLPFIVQDRARIHKILDGETGRDMLKSLEQKDIKGLAFFENGFRHLTNSKHPLNKPEDMIGMKIRVMENPIHIDTFKEFGAHPVPMPFGEVYTAMEQKIIEGQENPLLVIKTSKFYEVQKHLSLTGHFYSLAVLVINTKVFESLTTEQQNAVNEAAMEARDFERKFIAENELRQIEELKARGMTVTVPDTLAFQKTVEAVYKKYEPEIGKHLIDQVRGVK